MKKYNVVWWCLAIFLSSCASNDFQKNQVDILMRDMTQEPTYSIILYDMNVEGTFFKEYQHQYRIIKGKPGEKPEEEITGWYPVSESFFQQHVDDMGMELASKNEQGEVTKNVAPPGYSNYVGNNRYGYWQQGSGGSSFWTFYGQYAFMSSLFNLAAFPIRRSYYDDYRSYRNTGRTYYGPTTGGRRAYGTGSTYTSSARPNSTWSRSSSSRSFRNSTQRTSRSGSRYNSSGSMRSRGGGFGK